MNRSTLAQSAMLAPRRTPLRMDAQDGPWSVSVAASPHDSKSFSIYITSPLPSFSLFLIVIKFILAPTHNVTLTRTITELKSLHVKLHDAHPETTFPELPLDLSDVSATAGGKRRSSFLHTLSRLASPGPKNRPPHGLPSPAKESNEDPFAAAPQSTLTALASYLTIISNDQLLRVSKPWRRFVHVRVDDLESVRVERAIKRVRSDVAIHLNPKGMASTASVPSSTNVSVHAIDDLTDTETSTAGLRESDIQEEVEAEAEQDVTKGKTSLPPASDSTDMDATTIAETDSAMKDEPSLLDDENTAAAASMVTTGNLPTPTPSPAARTVELPPAEEQNVEGPKEPTPSVSHPPSASAHVHRIPRSASADPDKATRLSRVFQSGSVNGESDEPPFKRRKKDGKVEKKPSKKVQIDDFEMMRVLGKGCAGKVLLVRYKASNELYALKAITKRHVLAHQELQHTLTEQAVLKRMAHEGKDPFVVKLWWSFHDKENLFLVMDFHPGGDLATQLARWGRLGRDRARFYAAEIVEGLEGLHAAGVVYRDLKPENILIGADGHIVLTDFGLSKEFPRPKHSNELPTAPATPSAMKDEFYSSSDVQAPVLPHWMNNDGGTSSWRGPPSTDTTSTFCGTAEYLAPEVIQGLPYSYEVDWWSFGTMLYEMLTGITPFWANNHSDMYVRVLQDELQFPEDKSMDQDTKSLIRGLLQRNPALRMSEPRVKRHPYFSMIDWAHVYHKRYIPPYVPPIDSDNPSDTQNFDDAFLDMDPTLDGEPDPEFQTDSERERTDDDRTDGEDSVQTPAQSRSPSAHPIDDDLFDGYSFKGRQSILIDDDDDYEMQDDQDNDDRSSVAPIMEADEGAFEDESSEIKTPEPTHAALPEVDESTHAVESEDLLDAPSPIANETDLSLPTPRTSYEKPEAVDVSEFSLALAAPLPPSRSPSPSPSPSPLLSPSPSPPEPAASTAVDIVSASPVLTSENLEPVTKNPVEATPVAAKTARTRPERSGIPALDRHLAREPDAEIAPTEAEDDDWDLVEPDGGEEFNGSKGASLFARGVVDRYRLAVFRKTSGNHRRPQRTTSGMSADSEGDLPDSNASPLREKIRRGRTPGLPFRKAPKQFLRAKSPPTTFVSSSATSRASLAKSSVTFTDSTPSSGLPSSRSLKSKESATSVTGPAGSSSDQSLNGDAQRSLSHSAAEFANSGFSTPKDSPKRTLRVSSAAEDRQGTKMKKIKKYKEGAEKVLSLFGSPRSQS
ncbi:hypothetical protein SISNIDRAFT_474447 [Sistotremastrum niveocremeum HHB9708]|uniref:non-specific serine/threonine protein kinase n=1 Tax=Sistotremastrum niveocremeum HHB9708 TaxID=1314777 RepID=A0A164UTS4_9AGAM|nr:hypothetical protein SISNIDRAFT_474447 [Sistotremastrum niveocremeum HHB9708]